MQPRNRRSIDGMQPRRRSPQQPSVQRQSTPLPQVRKQQLKPAQSPRVDLQSKVVLAARQNPIPKSNLAKPENVPDTLLQNTQSLSLPQKTKKHRLRTWIIALVAVVTTIVVAGLIAASVWFQNQLSPVSDDTTKRVKVVIEQGSSTSSIGQELEAKGVIKSQLAFSIYMKLSGKTNRLQAGAYSLQPSLSTPAIIDHLMSGKADTFKVTFLPGGTVAEAKKTLLGLGYSAQEIDAAFAMTYDRPLFATKPISSDLEGYIYGETIEFDFSASVEAILEKFFDQFENFVEKNDLAAAYKKRGLTLYEGITLASIVQREVPIKDMPAVARVFLNRLKAGMTLGSDVTYQYAAKKLGVEPNPSLDSPYNTRKHAGLPPGPIATPGNSALLAVAHPANNDYLYFLSGDDGKTYFSKTDEGHQQNIVQHCQEKCKLP